MDTLHDEVNYIHPLMALLSCTDAVNIIEQLKYSQCGENAICAV